MQHRNLNKRYNHDALSIKIKIPNLPSVKIMKYEVEKKILRRQFYPSHFQLFKHIYRGRFFCKVSW